MQMENNTRISVVLRNPISKRLMTDVSGSLLNWLKLSGTINEEIESFFQISGIDSIFKAFMQFFPGIIKISENVESNYRKMVDFLNQSTNDLFNIEANDFESIDPEIIEIIAKSMLYSMNMTNKELFCRYLQSLDSQSADDLDNFIKGFNPKTKDYQQISIDIRNYCKNMDNLLISQNEVDLLNQKLISVEENGRIDMERQQSKTQNAIAEKNANIDEMNVKITNNRDNLKRLNDIYQELEDIVDYTHTINDLESHATNLDEKHQYLLKIDSLEQEINQLKDLVSSFNYKGIDEIRLRSLISKKNEVENRIKENKQNLENEKNSGITHHLIQEITALRSSHKNLALQVENIKKAIL